MNITRRSALRAATAAAAAIGGAVSLPARNEATANPVQEPLVTLWQKRSRFMSKADRLADEAAAIERTLPDWARTFAGITIQCPGCKPRTCRTAEQIDAAMRGHALFSLDPPSKNAVLAWRAEGKAQRDTWAIELAGIRQRFDRERERAGYTAKNAEYEAVMDRGLEIEAQIVDTQAVTVDGLLVQALFCAELEKDNEPKFFTTRLGKSMGIAARRMAPGLAQAERLLGED